MSGPVVQPGRTPTVPDTPAARDLEERNQFVIPGANPYVLAHLTGLVDDLNSARSEAELAKDPVKAAARVKELADERERILAEARRTGTLEREELKKDPITKDAPTVVPPTEEYTTTQKAGNWVVDNIILNPGMRVEDVRRHAAPVIEKAEELIKPVVERVMPARAVIDIPPDPTAYERYTQQMATIAQWKLEHFLDKITYQNPFVAQWGDHNTHFQASMQMLNTLWPLLEKVDPDAYARLRPKFRSLLSLSSSLTFEELEEMGYDTSKMRDYRKQAELLGVFSAQPMTYESLLAQETIPKMARQLDVTAVAYDAFRRYRLATEELRSTLQALESDTAMPEDIRQQLRVDAWHRVCNEWVNKTQQTVLARMVSNLAMGYKLGVDEEGRFNTEEFTALTLLVEQRRRTAENEARAGRPNAVDIALVEGFGTAVNFGWVPSFNQLRGNPGVSAMLNSVGITDQTNLSAITDDQLAAAIDTIRRGSARSMERAEHMLTTLGTEVVPYIELRREVEALTMESLRNPPELRGAFRQNGTAWEPTEVFTAATARFTERANALEALIRGRLDAGPDRIEARLREYLEANKDDPRVTRQLVDGVIGWFHGILPKPPATPAPAP